MLDYSGTKTSDFGDAPPNITCKCTDTDGFYKDIAEKYGIDKYWITWGKRRVLIHSGCQHAGSGAKECQEKYDSFWYNYPLPGGDIQIPNPKGVIGANYTQMRNLKSRMESESKDIDISLSTFAVTSMDKIVETGNEDDEQKRKSAIANFLMAFLMLIPMVGSTAGALGATMLRTIINVAGELANIGVAIYEVLDDPDNALLSALGLLLRGVSLKPFKEVAQARRGMKDGELEKLGPIKNDLKNRHAQGQVVGLQEDLRSVDWGGLPFVVVPLLLCRQNCCTDPLSFMSCKYHFHRVCTRQDSNGFS
ncbi:hypothetical protein HBI72_154370 [Parastagonospora nodorum]|nr:hypothetical protein HBI72_154370 [Parastagonospora nodorum]